MRYLANAFSLNMVAEFPFDCHGETLSLEAAKALAADAMSVVGHAETAAVFANVLGMPVPFNRANVVLHKGDDLVVGQYRGPRLPEGATELPAGATIMWCHVLLS